MRPRGVKRSLFARPERNPSLWLQCLTRIVPVSLNLECFHCQHCIRLFVPDGKGQNLGEGRMAGWQERRCAANSLGVEVDFIVVRLEAATRAVYTFCLVPSFFFVCVSSAISVALRGSEISELPLTHSDTPECFGITPRKKTFCFHFKTPWPYLPATAFALPAFYFFFIPLSAPHMRALPAC